MEGVKSVIEELILVRHGKAEDRAEMADDTQRALTDKGIRELQRTLPGLVSLIGAQRNTLLWSSPLKRAAQTAAFIADSLGIADVNEFEFIGDGDWKAFSRKLAGVKQPGCLIVVGHQPYLSDWSQSLAGLPLPFKKGAAAGFRLNSSSPLKGELLWFLQPKALKRLDIRSADFPPPMPPA
ncbi:MAG: histidine phosphatase family protein [Syntrophomonadaceae bacterium]